MHVAATPMPTGDHPQGHTDKESTAHGPPEYLGMLLPPPAYSDETVKQGHSRGLLCMRDVYCASRTPPSRNTMVTDAAITSV
jgi:hypothetical protein